MGKTLPVVLILLLVGVGYQIWVKSTASAGALGYQSDWNAAVKEARSTGKPIMLVFGGPW